jgi:hypothetical protein
MLSSPTCVPQVAVEMTAPKAVLILLPLRGCHEERSEEYAVVSELPVEPNFRIGDDSTAI